MLDFSPAWLAIVRTLPPCGARVRARLNAGPTALAESRCLRPRPGAFLSPSKPLAANASSKTSNGHSMGHHTGGAGCMSAKVT